MVWVQNYKDIWVNPFYTESQNKVFSIVDNYLQSPPISILDIGCGFAQVSNMFQKKYGTELYLLDGDSSNQDVNRINKWGSTQTMSYYSPVDGLAEHFDSQGMEYTFVDASNPSIAADKKFSLIYSFLSCGFHYPLSAYADLIKKHSDENTIIIVDVRYKCENKQETDYTVIENLTPDKRKYSKLHIKLN